MAGVEAMEEDVVESAGSVRGEVGVDESVERAGEREPEPWKFVVLLVRGRPWGKGGCATNLGWECERRREELAK